jgi:hypothetical protein
MTGFFFDGWGSVLAFRQNGTLQRFTLPAGSSSAGPFAFTFSRRVRVDIVVFTLRPFT